MTTGLLPHETLLHNTLLTRPGQVKAVCVAVGQVSHTSGGSGLHTYLTLCLLGREVSRLPDSSLAATFSMCCCCYVLVGFSKILNPPAGRDQTTDRVCWASSHLQSGTTNRGSDSRLIYLIDQARSEAVSSAALLLCTRSSAPTSWSQHSSLLQWLQPSPPLLHVSPVCLLLISFSSRLYFFTQLPSFPSHPFSEREIDSERKWESKRQEGGGRERKRERQWLASP